MPSDSVTILGTKSMRETWSVNKLTLVNFAKRLITCVRGRSLQSTTTYIIKRAMSLEDASVFLYSRDNNIATNNTI